MDVTYLLEQFLSNHASGFVRLGTRDKWQFQQRWREHFATGVKEATGKWVLNGIDWHAFSSSYTPCLKGSRAEIAYRQLEVEAFVLLSSNEHLPGYICTARELPDLNDLYAFTEQNPQVLDLYLFAPDLRWTMVLTHEQEHGPFLAQSNQASKMEG